MILRHALVFGIGVALAASAVAQGQPAGHGATPPPSPGKPASARPGVPHTLAEALAATYANQPALQAERAKLRATDENVPTALAGWRPTVVLAGTAGYGNGLSRSYSSLLVLSGQDPNTKVVTERDVATAQATITQPLYNGGRTEANVNRAKDQVFAERASLIAQEQTSFTNTVNAYVGVIEAQDLLALNINNEQVLEKQLQATNDRFRVGEITRTDVAQAEAALAGATAQRQTAEGNLATARATFVQVVGFYPPTNLVEPQPLALPVRAEREASAMAAANNPNVIAAEFNDSAAKDAVDVAFSQLMPQVSLQGQTFGEENPGGRSSEATGYQVLAQVSVPLYQGGAEYSAVRQAKQTEQQSARLVADAQRTAVQAAVQAWETLAAATAAAASTRSQIRANEVALEGTEREAIVGSRTTLDVLNAQQALLSSRVSLVQNLAQLVTASYQVAAAIGRLTARDLRLPVPLYDDTAYYNAVKNKWFGLGDYATHQPGRKGPADGWVTVSSASQTPPAEAPGGASANDPSMEDILASIRRILSEEEPAAAPAPPSAAAEPPAPPEKPDDVLVLDPSMLVQEPAPPPLAEPEPPLAVVGPPVAPAVPIEPMVPMEFAPPSALLAPEAEAAATTSVGTLMRTLATERTLQVHRDGPTIEDVVREELRPLLKLWLDANLPGLVERLVRAEIERVVRRAVP